MKVLFETLGCKLNQAETEALARQFAFAGYELATDVKEADVYILNTCTVTHTADSKSRHLLRLAHRRNPQALLVATGCYAQRVASELAEIEGVRLVVGNEQKVDLLQILQGIGHSDGLNSSGEGSAGTVKADVLRTRALIKIQDGCRNFCAYCIVPFVRSNEKSVPLVQVIREVGQRAKEGYQEVVLTGTRVGAYSSGGIDLKGLLERILKETDIPRIRLSSLQPQEISPELISLWRNSRLCPHFHLSLQSGSATVLARMKRRYTPAEYEQTVALIRKKVPAVAITTDIIVGFPGETDGEFRESLEFCRCLEFARIHVFPFSSRSGTEAAKMAGQVAEKTKKERSQKMLALAEESARRFKEKFAGELLDVLWEKQTEDGLWSGVTGNYIRVYTRGNRDLGNKLLSVEMK
jgi:threonylcarbamoyladenosine tRNA methylthiotransferase MtaB